MNWLSIMITAIVAIVAASVAGAAAYSSQQGTIGDLETANVRLSYNTASGGGVNRKMMPDPLTGEATAAMDEVFSFDRNHAICRVETNPVAFTMPTFAMGDVTIEPHSFFMSMVATTIDQYVVSTRSDGSREVVMRGGLDCATEVGQADITIGDRQAAEHATYRITATDAGLGGGAAGDTFAFTVFFSEQDAPINYAIFGPEFTFTGEMTTGEISIVNPER
ncbi:MAG: hypothetical protein O3B84_07310 [Chloroflexi bacterium]|nr:hypothetical protein [Chloroflexota bacterium]